MYDGSSMTFRPGMKDLGELDVVIQIMRTRKLCLFESYIYPQLRRHELDVYVPPEIWSNVGQEEARELAVFHGAKRLAGEQTDLD
jgi:hypothetical protein